MWARRSESWIDSAVEKEWRRRCLGSECESGFGGSGA